MVIIKKHLSQPWFDYVQNGIKTVEGRLDRGDFAKLQLGDEILFYNDDNDSISNISFYQEILCHVLKIIKYRSFKELLEQEGVRNVIPGRNLDEAIRIYRMIYNEEDEMEYGVLAIHMVM